MKAKSKKYFENKMKILSLASLVAFLIFQMSLVSCSKNEVVDNLDENETIDSDYNIVSEGRAKVALISSKDTSVILTEPTNPNLSLKCSKLTNPLGFDCELPGFSGKGEWYLNGSSIKSNCSNSNTCKMTNLPSSIYFVKFKGKNSSKKTVATENFVINLKN